MRRPTAPALAVALSLLAWGCGGGPERSVESFCEQRRSSGDAVELDPENIEAGRLEEQAEVSEELADRAPDEIAGEVENVADYLRSAADVFADVDPSDPDVLNDPEVRERFAELERQGEDLAGDGDKIRAFVQAECDIASGEDGGADPEGGEPQE